MKIRDFPFININFELKFMNTVYGEKGFSFYINFEYSRRPLFSKGFSIYVNFELKFLNTVVLNCIQKFQFKVNINKKNPLSPYKFIETRQSNNDGEFILSK